MVISGNCRYENIPYIDPMGPTLILTCFDPKVQRYHQCDGDIGRSRATQIDDAITSIQGGISNVDFLEFVQGNFQVPPKMVPLSHKAPINFQLFMGVVWEWYGKLPKRGYHS